MQGAYRRGNSFSVVYGRLDDPGRFTEFKDALTSDPQLSVRVERESEYFAEQSRALSMFVSVVGYGIAVLMALGALFGAGLAWLLFNGFTVSTLNFSSFSQVVFAFAVTPGLLLQGIVIALVIGLVGGLAPAIRAARMPIVSALRE